MWILTPQVTVLARFCQTLACDGVGVDAAATAGTAAAATAARPASVRVRCIS
jgi:hypothetical protein